MHMASFRFRFIHSESPPVALPPFPKEFNKHQVLTSGSFKKKGELGKSKAHSGGGGDTEIVACFMLSFH